MLVNEFKLLSKDEQCHLLWDEGVYICWRNKEGLTLNLYSLFDYYVELAFDLTYNHLRYVKAFTDHRLLEPYLDSIKIVDEIK